MATDEICGFPFRTENYLDDYYIYQINLINGEMATDEIFGYLDDYYIYQINLINGDG